MSSKQQTFNVVACRMTGSYYGPVYTRMVVLILGDVTIVTYTKYHYQHDYLITFLTVDVNVHASCLPPFSYQTRVEVCQSYPPLDAAIEGAHTLSRYSESSLPWTPG